MKKLAFIGVVLMIVAVGSFAVAFIINFGNANGREEAQLAALNAAIDLPEQLAALISNTEYLADAHDDGLTRITPYTQIIYDYFDHEEDAFNQTTETAAETLVGMTKDEIAAFFADWEIITFNAEYVHLRQTTNLHTRQYIIGVHDGYIAVFYDNGSYRIKELTSRPVAALADEEQERLTEGIKVEGNEALMRALEDFSS